MGNQHIGLQSDQLFCECLNSDCVSIAPAIIDSEVSSIRPAELLKALLKYGHAGADIGIAFGNRHQHANTANSLRLLRTRGERPRSRTAEQRDERAPVHCPVPPVLPTERIAHLGTAGDCCAAGFRPNYIGLGSSTTKAEYLNSRPFRGTGAPGRFSLRLANETG